jgi:hypothetical protein
MPARTAVRCATGKRSAEFARLQAVPIRGSRTSCRMQELPKEELVQFVDDTGATRRVESADVTLTESGTFATQAR